MTPRQLIDTALLGSALALGSVPARALPVLQRVLDQPCRAIALDREPYVAALGNDAVTVFDKRGSHQEALPEALRGKGVDVGVFFGRDYRVRIAGLAHTQKGDEVRYYRSLPGGIKSALDELGPLGKPGGPGLVALLGTADPEIVCRVGESCLIKRISGWAKASAPAGLTRVGLSLGTGWAIAGTSFYTLGKDWQALPVPGPWRAADDAFVRGTDACVVEHDASRLHHFDGKAWHSSNAPIAGPRTVWASEDSFWLGGDGGVAVFDDGALRRLDGALHVAQVLGRSASDVWVCAAEGVFRAMPPQ
ncbi:MAG TPA: hypothetical protein VHP33_23635 [Polyangiaceae bacterium]|nr:hypothetical protein [Polyangiaceae bacterium]